MKTPRTIVVLGVFCICVRWLGRLWGYLEGDKAPSEFQDFANNLYAAALNYDVGEEITDAQAKFYRNSVAISWGSACEWQILTSIREELELIEEFCWRACLKGEKYVCNRKRIEDAPAIYQSEAYGRLKKMEMLFRE